ncbi:ASCH domain protein [Posidoniimonas polymericola]|uniref:ASCH domain protein n=1 Tax=Posidoniimonas polymericola TaxID=2528002 RepID=A0A5C5YDF9_9BACT|nr:ASCH domain-containing protein [Posidoniimonas polymericola]TWT73756.1 ASCH domain protein [Posidoniimonas polymericola]
MLLFKKKFLEPIRAGRKTQTIRLWSHRRMRAGQQSYIPGIGPIEVTEVAEVRLEELTDQDALRDGFADAAALRQELELIYGDKLAAGYSAYRVRFRVGEPTGRAAGGRPR